MAYRIDTECRIEADFWGAEVKAGETVPVKPEPGRAVHISQISLGQAEKDTTGPVLVNLKVDDSMVDTVQISAENTPHLPGLWMYNKPFEISHDWENGSVYFIGYTTVVKDSAKYSSNPKEIAVEDSDHLEDTTSGDLSQDSSPTSDSEYDSGSEGVSEEVEETPKKKRPSQSPPAHTPFSANKAKLETPQHTALRNPPYPNKRPRLTDTPHCFIEESTFVFANVVMFLQRGQTRVKKLLSEQSDYSEILTEFEAKTDELLGLMRMPTLKVHQRDRLCELIRQALELWVRVENQIEQQPQSSAHQLALTPSDYQEPVPSAWVMMSNWHGPAYQEIESIRNKHSRLLVRAYKAKHGECSESNKVSVPLLLLYKKQLNLLALSREDIEALPKYKCYRRVMGIKSLVTQEKYTASMNLNGNLPEQGASTKSRGQAQCSGRFEIYKQIMDIRKKHSCKLDEAYRNIRKLDPTLMRNENAVACLAFLEESLQFLSKCRADLVFLSKKACLEQLKEIKLFLEDAAGSVPARQFWRVQVVNGHWQFLSESEAPLTNWRDVAYEKLQTKVDKFNYLVLDEYLKKRKEWYQKKWWVPKVKKLDGLFRQLGLLYQMRRASMNLFMSKENYFAFVDHIAEDLHNIKDLIKELPDVGSLAEWDPRKVIPKPF